MNTFEGRTPPVPAEVSGELVRVEMMRVAPSGVFKDDLIERTGLTTSQVSNGLRWIKVTGAAAHCTPYSYSRKNGYRFSEDPVDWAIYVKAEVGVTLTKMDRVFKGTLQPFLELLPDDTFAEYFYDQTKAYLSAMKAGVERPYPPPQTTGGEDDRPRQSPERNGKATTRS